MGRDILAEQEHHLRDGGLRGDVSSGHNSGSLQGVAGRIASGKDAAADTLGHVEHDQSAVNSLLQGIEEPGSGRSVAGAERTQDNAFGGGSVERVTESILAQTRKEVNDDDRLVKPVIDLERLMDMMAVKGILVVVYVKTYLGEFGVIVAFESVEIIGRTFRGPVSAPELVFEKDGVFLHHRIAVTALGGRYLLGGYLIFLTVGAVLAYGELRAGDDHRLAEILEH